jgi:hypothetical protein
MRCSSSVNCIGDVQRVGGGKFDVDDRCGGLRATLIRLVYHCFDAMMVASFLIFLTNNPDAKWRKVARWIPLIAWIAIPSTFDLGFLCLAYPDLGNTMNPLSHLTSMGARHFFHALTIGVVTRWFLRRWNDA